MKTIVTGAAGLIGSALVRQLNLDAVEDIVVVDRLGESEKWRHLVPLRFADYLEAEEFFARIADDPDAFGDVGTVFHLVDDGEKRVVSHREQRAALAGDRAVGAGAWSALRLRVVGRDLRRARR
jgi:nucleoside-diphosphate-sugar epimerase